MTAKFIKEYFNLTKEPIHIFNNVHEGLDFIKTNLKGIAGIYGYICLSNLNIYIGSAQDLAIRPKKHLNEKTATNKH